MNNSTNSTEILTLSNGVFCVYLTSTCLLILKMMVVTFLTAYNRFKYRVFISPEDCEGGKGVMEENDNVERPRRAYMNDLENIPIYFAAGFAYLWTQPTIWVAFLVYFGFTIVRIFHTIVYTLIIVPQPTRAILFLSGLLITAYMTVHSMVYAFKHMVL